MKRRKIILWVLLCATLSILSLLGMAAFAAFSILDEKPFPLSTRTPDSQALASALKKLDTFSKTKAGKKRDWGDMLANFLLNPVQTVVLKKNEVNALIDAGLVEAHAKAAAEQPDAILADAGFDGEFFHVKVSRNVEKELKGFDFFGDFLNISMKFTPTIDDNHLKLNIQSLKIGDVPIPNRLYKEELDKELTLLERTEDAQRILSIAHSLKIENNELKLKYDAKELMLFLMERMPGLLNAAAEARGNPGMKRHASPMKKPTGGEKR